MPATLEVNENEMHEAPTRDAGSLEWILDKLTDFVHVASELLEDGDTFVCEKIRPDPYKVCLEVSLVRNTEVIGRCRMFGHGLFKGDSLVRMTNRDEQGIVHKYVQNLKANAFVATFYECFVHDHLPG